jgi:hypothetical protein
VSCRATDLIYDQLLDVVPYSEREYMPPAMSKSKRMLIFAMKKVRAYGKISMEWTE